MKSLSILFLLWFSILWPAEFEYQIIHSKTGEKIDLIQLAELTLQYDITFFGELHGNPVLHHLEIELLKEMYSRYPQLIVSLEMFERDVQPELDQFLAGEIGEEEFILASRAWSNYMTDYKPIIDFSQEKGLTVVAANIPRRLASLVNKKGLSILDSLSVEDRTFVSKRRNVWEDEYKESFVRTMKQNFAALPSEISSMKINIDNLYAAQCVKDDTMAESIWRVQRIPPRRKVLHFNGDFHSRKHLGTAQKLQYLEPMLRIAVIAPLVSADYSFSPADLEEGDFIIILPEE